MKKICTFVIFVALSALLLAFSAASAEEEKAPEAEFGTVCRKGIISSVTDTDGDGLLDAGGKVEIKLLPESTPEYISLSFSEEEFAIMALADGKNGKVSTAAEAYAVNAVVSMEYTGDISVFEKELPAKEDIEKIENGFISAALKNARATVLPEGNEVYSTYLSVCVGKKAELGEGVPEAELAFGYNAESGKWELCYKGVRYTLVKKLGTAAENPILVTENGKPIAFAEVESKFKSLAEGEMLALFGDIDRNEGGEAPAFELLDLKKSRSFAPVSEVFNPHSALRGEAFSYVLFDREARASVPYGRAFSSRAAAGAGLTLALSPAEAEVGYYEAVKLYSSAELEEFTVISGEKITGAQKAGEYVRVTLESGKTALLPGRQMLESREMEAELFYELYGVTCSATVRVNAAESSWFSSLALLYEEGGEVPEGLTGMRLTAALGAGGHALFAEIE